MLLSNCAVCGSKKVRFIKEQEAFGLVTSLLSVEGPLKGVSILGTIT